MIPASRRRLVSVMVIVAGLLAVLGFRLWNLQVQTRAGYLAMARQELVRSVVEPSVRGNIFDDTGQPMVSNQSALVVAVNMVTLSQQPGGPGPVLARLASLLHISPKVMQERVRLCTVGVPQPCWQGSPYQPIPVAQNVTDGVALQILENKTAYPGVTADIQPVIQYNQPVGTAAAQMLGYLQPITAQELQRLRVPVTGFSGDDLVGQSGLEAQYDKQLRGTTGVAEVAVNAAGQVTSTIKNIKPVAGNNLVTSINSKLQIATQNILANAVQAAQAANPGATTGAAVVMTTTGHVLAMASYPSYDPSIWSGGISQRQFNHLFGTANGEPILERATQGQYAPGSTWKVTTLTAGIKFGDPLYGSYDCPGATVVGGHTFNNDFGNSGPMSLYEALVRSCDTVFYNMGYQIYQRDHPSLNTVTSPRFPVQFEQQVEMDWGFGKYTGIDLPGESRGTIPTREWLYYFWKDNAHAGQNWCKYGRANGDYIQQIEYDDCHYGNVWTPGQAIIGSIGQGYIAVTPLQLATGYAALANGGTLYSPRIGAELLSPTGQVVQKITPPVAGHLPASGATLAYVRNALRGVVTAGTAAGTFGGFPLGKTCVAGKTGTAEVFGKSATSVFASFAPCNNPKYVAVVMIPDSGFGADVSGPAVRRIWDALYGYEGAKAALPGGNVPPLPHVTSGGTIVRTAASQLSAGFPGPLHAAAVAAPMWLADTRAGGRPAGRRG
ncbi:MAG TPA: penicillin-binding protein 2 [Streptosporangiaceae bacterium]|nr:penicillin-binding protein 2 [Streptosporangiaceae bacterium]